MDGEVLTPAPQEMSDAEKIAQWTKAIKAATTPTELDQVGAAIRKLPKSDAVKLALSAAYVQRKKELKPKPHITVRDTEGNELPLAPVQERIPGEDDGE